MLADNGMYGSVRKQVLRQEGKPFGLDRLLATSFVPIFFPCFTSRRGGWLSPPLNNSTRGVPGYTGKNLVVRVLCSVEEYEGNDEMTGRIAGRLRRGFNTEVAPRLSTLGWKTY